MTKLNLEVRNFVYNDFIIIIVDKPDGLREVYLRKMGKGITLYLYGVYSPLPELKQLISDNFYKYANDYNDMIAKLER